MSDNEGTDTLRIRVLDLDLVRGALRPFVAGGWIPPALASRCAAPPAAGTVNVLVVTLDAPAQLFSIPDTFIRKDTRP
jgi:hypothetical protein